MLTIQYTYTHVCGEPIALICQYLPFTIICFKSLSNVVIAITILPILLCRTLLNFNRLHGIVCGGLVVMGRDRFSVMTKLDVYLFHQKCFRCCSFNSLSLNFLLYLEMMKIRRTKFSHCLAAIHTSTHKLHSIWLCIPIKFCKNENTQTFHINTYLLWHKRFELIGSSAFYWKISEIINRKMSYERKEMVIFLFLSPPLKYNNADYENSCSLEIVGAPEDAIRNG